MKLTILILSFNRPKELRKKIEFWNNFENYNYTILIVDGSPTPSFFNIKNKNIKYIHFKSRDYHKRVFYVIKHINTDYFKLESDDDYFLPSSLQNAIKYLDKNKNYSAVYGEAGIYSVYNNKLYINHIFKKKLDLDSNNFKKRLTSYFLNQNYSPKLYYSLMRTTFFKKNVELWKRSKKKYGNKFQRFAEIHLPLTLLMSGKIKIFNQIFWIRKDDDIKKRVEFTSNKRLIKNDHSYLNISIWSLENIKTGYFDFFGKSLCKITNNKKYYSKFIVHEILNNYYLNSVNKSKKNTSIKEKLYKSLKEVLPIKLKKFIRFQFKLNGPEIKKCDEFKIKFGVNYKILELKYLKSILLKK